MKILAIARKDLLHSLRSAFLLVMMVVAPLLITGLIYLAFGGLMNSSGGMQLPRPTVLVVNLDQPDPSLNLKAGELLAEHLTGPDLASLLSAQGSPDAAAARQAVDSGQADLALTIPANFTAAVAQPQEKAAVILYHQPDNDIGARVVKAVVSDFIDGFAGAKIAVQVAGAQFESADAELAPGAAQEVAKAYVTWLQPGADVESVSQTNQAGEQTAMEPDQQPAYLISRPPADPDSGASSNANTATLFLGPVMSGLMVFFMFFTGAAAAQSILYEERDGTLARLFTTPTARWAILGGKMFAVVAALALQAVVLLAASALIFRIQWGQPASVALLTLGVVLAASGFGILLMSFIRSTRQAGPVMGLVVTLTGLMGGLMPTGDPSQPPPFERFTLALPQGWAQHGWRLVLAGGGPADILLPFLVLVGTGILLFTSGALIFRRRFQ